MKNLNRPGNFPARVSLRRTNKPGTLISMDEVKKYTLPTVLAMLVLYPLSYGAVRMLNPIKFCNDRIVMTPNRVVAEACNWLYLPLRRADRQWMGEDLIFSAAHP